MTTDTAQVYKAKLIEITKKISDIESLGFNTEKLKGELTSITDNVNSNVKKSKNHNFDGLVASDYMNATSELTKLESKLDEYDIYFKAYNFALYVNKISLNESNIDNIREEIKRILNGLRNSSNVDYEDEKVIVEGIYDAVFKVICYEIEKYNSSEIYDYCKNYDTDKLYLHAIIAKNISNIQLSDYREIEEEILRIRKGGLDSNLFDIDLLKKIIFRDRKEEFVKSVEKRTNEIVMSHNMVIVKQNQLNEEISNNQNSIVNLKQEITRLRLTLSKRIACLLISLSIPVGSFLISKKLLEEPFTEYTYDVSYDEFNTIYDKTNHEVKRENLLKPEEYNQVIVNKYTPFEAMEGGLDGRYKYTYDVSFLEYDNIEDYIDYVKNECKYAPTISTEYLRDLDNPIDAQIDYYEVVKRYVDIESKKEEIGIGAIYGLPFIISFAISFVLFMINDYLAEESMVVDYYYFPLSDFLDEIYELKEYKKDVVKYQKEIKQKLPLLLEEIGKSKELRTIFNEEFSKQKDILEHIKYELAKPDNLDEPVKKLLKK